MFRSIRKTVYDFFHSLRGPRHELSSLPPDDSSPIQEHSFQKADLDLQSLAIESSLDGIAILDKNECYSYVNKSHAKVYGFNDPEELLGRSWRILYGDDELHRFEQYLMPRLQQEGRLTIEAMGKRKDGSFFPQELSLTAIPGGGLVCIVRDISTRKRVEQDAEQIALFSSLNPSPVLRFDLIGSIIMANPAAVDFLGLMASPDLRVQDFIPNFSENQLQHCIRRASVITRTSWVKDKAFQFIIKGVPYLNVGHVYASEITDLMRAEQELRESRAFLRELIDTDPNLIFVKDAEGRFTLVNRSVAEIFGKEQSEILGRRDDELNPRREETDSFQSDDQEVIRSGQEKFIAEETITDRHGKLHYLQTVKRPLLGPGGKGKYILGVGTDITAQKELQEMLIQSSKLEAIGQLAGGVAHDFNNILTGILGYTALLQHADLSKEEYKDGIGKIEGAALRAGELTEQLLGFARKNNEKKTLVNLTGIISESLELLARTLERSINIESVLVAEEINVFIDPVQLQQIILNLGINARDAIVQSAQNGILRISTRRTNFPEPRQVLAGVLPPGEYCELVVHDTGCGMSKEILNKAFEPFFTTKSSGKGTGMGLSLVYGIVKQVGGGIHVESELHIGTTVSVWLPIAQSLPIGPLKASSSGELIRKDSAGALPLHDATEDSHSAALSLREKIEKSPCSAQILLVDDHSVIRDSTSQILRSMGYGVATASNGAEAVDYYRIHRHEIDLVILDMIMPRMGARECFRVIKGLNPHVKVILSTGYLNSAAVEEVLRDGVLGFVQKPYQVMQLNEAIQSALDVRLGPDPKTTSIH